MTELCFYLSVCVGNFSKGYTLIHNRGNRLSKIKSIGGSNPSSKISVCKRSTQSTIFTYNKNDTFFIFIYFGKCLKNTFSFKD